MKEALVRNDFLVTAFPVYRPEPQQSVHDSRGKTGERILKVFSTRRLKFKVQVCQREGINVNPDIKCDRGEQEGTCEDVLRVQLVW